MRSSIDPKDRVIVLEGDPASDSFIFKPSDAVRLVPKFTWDVELFYVLYLCSDYRCLGYSFTVGVEDHVMAVPLHSIEGKARRLNSKKVLFAHTHPNGSPHPSHQDIRVTHDYHHLLKDQDINLLDHLIITRGDWFSLRFNVVYWPAA